jgi:hypothetical protein
MIGGRKIVASPALLPHATRHGDLYFVLRAHVAPGYLAVVDLLTRHDEQSDFATDACVLKDGIDPRTGARHLEEMAFEVVSEQTERFAAEKAIRMYRRGVRRIFALFVKGEARVGEWSPESSGWRLLDAGAAIEDRCLVRPLAVAALLDAAAADRAVIEALAARESPALRRRDAAIQENARVEGQAEGKAEGRAQGELKGRAEALLQVLAARGLAVSPAERRKILRCSNLERLEGWLRRSALASSTGEALARL